jgi:protein TIF31
MNCLVYIGSYSIFFANCRILRGRALYKVTCDFVDAAVKGAVGVINRCIPPINPTDPECFHM